jgi:hypothetical protein
VIFAVVLSQPISLAKWCVVVIIFFLVMNKLQGRGVLGFMRERCIRIQEQEVCFFFFFAAKEQEVY